MGNRRLIPFTLLILFPSLMAPAAPAALNVVAAENFYGSIAVQIGGQKAAVTSILADPNVDPHEYESSVVDAKAVAAADLVIENGGGYDDWMDKLLAASPRPRRVLLKAFDIVPKKLPDNEHVWYDLDNAQAVARALADGFSRLDPANAATYSKNLESFAASLSQVRQKMTQIGDRWKGEPIGMTETIFLYQSEAMGLNVLTPLQFQEAIAEGNDPPADTVVTAVNQVREKKIKVLIYNEQTVSPITTRLQNEAKTAGIPVVPVTETMPSATKYQDWMMSQLLRLERALGK
jgi:zinc/manganese transport system substrate-binding protein